MAKSGAVRKWEPARGGPKDIGDLSFIGRDNDGHPIWWMPEVPKTQYGHAHEAIGRTYAFEFLDLVNHESHDPESTGLYLGFIASAALRRTKDWRDQTIAESFFRAIGDHLAGRLYR